MTKKIGLIVGSLRKDSFTGKLAENLIPLFPEGYEAKLVDISALELYNEDKDGDTAPASYGTFRDEVKTLDGVIFATPEYNRSVPAVLKNALDVGSRPYGQSVWDGKPAAILSASPGALSGFGANHHLRQPLVFLNMPILQQPEAYIGNIAAKLDDNGKCKDPADVEFLQKFVDAYVALVEKNS